MLKVRLDEGDQNGGSLLEDGPACEGPGMFTVYDGPGSESPARFEVESTLCGDPEPLGVPGLEDPRGEFKALTDLSLLKCGYLCANSSICHSLNSLYFGG